MSASVDPSFTTERGTPSMNGSGLIELLAREMTLELNREKIIPGGKEVTVFIGPVKPGRYPFFGEFNQDTAQGVVIVK